MDALHQPGQRRYRSPAQKNARNPRPRSDFVQDQVAGHFEKKIPDKENSGRNGKLLAAQAQILIHRQPGKADVDPVDHRDDVKQE